MNVPAERRLGARGQETARRTLYAGDIVPMSWRVRAGVHEQPSVVFKGQWQSSKEIALRAVELKPRPIERVGGDLAHDCVDRETGVGAIANVVTQKNEAAYAGTFRMRERGLERFPVGVNIAE